MTDKEIKILKSFKTKKILVIGELMIDAYVQGSCSRIAPEASVPVIDIVQKKYCLGGAGNVAANLAALGAQVFFTSICGNDDSAEIGSKLLEDAKLNPDFIIKAGQRTTLFKTRVSSDSQLLVRFDEGSTDAICPELEEAFINKIEVLYKDVDAVVIADYGKGLMSANIIDKLATLKAGNPKVVSVDSKNHHHYLKLGPTLIKPNFQEAAQAIGYSEPGRPDVAILESWGERLYKNSAAGLVFLTMDQDGVCVFENGKYQFHKSVPQVVNANVSGAGDTFLAAATMAIASKADLETATNIAITAAHHVVNKPETAVCNLNEILMAKFQLGKLVQRPEDIRQLSKRLKSENKKIVFTNGCFDILHSGHVSYLRGAKARGDVLIVGLNNDKSIKRLKGPSRPVNNLKDRIEVLSELSCIDYIVPFGNENDDTPIGLVKQVKPDVFVKGGDYENKFLPEEVELRKINCEIVFLPMVANQSTSNTIKKIRDANAYKTVRVN